MRRIVDIGLFSNNSGDRTAKGQVFSSQVVGEEQAIRALNELGSKFARKVLRKAVRAGGAVFVKAAKRNAPTRKKHLKKSIKQKIKLYPASGTVVSIVGARNKKFADGSNPAKYLHLVELGTRAHTINPKKGQVLHIKGRLVARVNHPGSPAQKFLQQSRDSKIRESIAAFSLKLSVETELEAQKIALARGPESSAVKELEAFF